MTDLLDARTAIWLEDVLGSPFRLVGSLSFGVTSELALVEADGRRFVLRRYPDPAARTDRPGLVQDEVRVLHAARAVLGPLVPEPIAYDAAGTVAGLPALVMTHLRGTPVIHGLDPVRLVEPLSAAPRGRGARPPCVPRLVRPDPRPRPGLVVGPAARGAAWRSS